MKSPLALVVCLLLASSSLLAQERKGALGAYFERLKTFPNVSVVEEPVSALARVKGKTPEITINTLHHLSEQAQKKDTRGTNGGVASNDPKGVLEVVLLPERSSLEAEQQLLVDNLFASEEFSDAVLTTKIKEGEEAISLFIPKKKDEGPQPVALYILILKEKKALAVRLSGNYAVNTNWHITEKDRPARR